MSDPYDSYTRWMQKYGGALLMLFALAMVVYLLATLVSSVAECGFTGVRCIDANIENKGETP